MFSMPIVDLLEEGRKLADSRQARQRAVAACRHSVFLARGREYRSEFHINPSDETMHMIKGEMRLHYRTPEGKEEVALIPEGSIIYTPAGTPHSPRFPPDAFALISERKRRTARSTAFSGTAQSATTYCTKKRFVVQDYADDPVSKAYKRFSTAKNSAPAKNAAKSCPRRKRSKRARDRVRN